MSGRMNNSSCISRSSDCCSKQLSVSVIYAEFVPICVRNWDDMTNVVLFSAKSNKIHVWLSHAEYISAHKILPTESCNKFLVSHGEAKDKAK